MQSQGLPAYTEYPTQLPDDFPIGRHKVQPLVNVTELQAHLRLLGAIRKLKEDVQTQQDGVAATNRDLAWVVFVNRAVHRFDIWASSAWPQGSPGLDETVIPPLDVIMVWHSYLLNPRAYYEDSQRMDTTYCRNLQKIQSMPLTLISFLIDPQTLEPEMPSSERQAFFETMTSLPFSMPLVTEYSDAVTVDCPFCKRKNHLVRWVAFGGTGFAQPNFEYTCESCHKRFKKSNMGIRRFAEEVTRKRIGEKVYISETLLDPRTGVIDIKEADAVATRIFKTLNKKFKLKLPLSPAQVPQQAQALASGLKYDHKTLSNYFHTSVRPMYESLPDATPLPRIQRICVAYSHAGLASLDLVGAILRQGAFVDKMVRLGWTRAGRFDRSRDLVPLVRSVARYHAFLDLMVQNPTVFLVPTLDIDLAWHSHQLKGEQYRSDTMSYMGRTPNHDDSVDPIPLSSGYDITAKAWRSRYGVPYSVCGCVPDPDSGSFIGRFTSKIGTLGKKDKDATPTRPVNRRPDLVSIEDDEADSSHPSEHNLHFGDPDDPVTKMKKETREKQSIKCAASAKKGASRDPWRALQAERGEKRKEADHREAFTDPRYGYGHYYPYWGVSMAVPYGFYGGYGYDGGYGSCGTGCGAGGCASRAGCGGGTGSSGCGAGCGGG